MTTPPPLTAEPPAGTARAVRPALLVPLAGEPLRDEPGPGAARCLGLYAKLAAGVSVVTARGEDGPVGMTVSAVTSVSARPPLLLACLSEGSRTLAAIREHGAFGVHLLREEQHELAVRFASPAVTAAARFAGTDPAEVLGVPVLPGALAWSVCLLEDVRGYGDHQVVVGRLAAVHVGGGHPLLWHDRAFRSLGERRDSAARGPAARGPAPQDPSVQGPPQDPSARGPASQGSAEQHPAARASVPQNPSARGPAPQASSPQGPAGPPAVPAPAGTA